jgi:hypothetical protein
VVNHSEVAILQFPKYIHAMHPRSRKPVSDAGLNLLRSSLLCLYQYSFDRNKRSTLQKIRRQLSIRQKTGIPGAVFWNTFSILPCLRNSHERSASFTHYRLANMRFADAEEFATNSNRALTELVQFCDNSIFVLA